ncbi:MAG: Na+/H+ antiporter NhaC family protein [Peptoniphilaceae bacterium]
MLEIVTLVIFSVLVILSSIKDISIIYALFIGYWLFITYGRIKGFYLKDLLKMSLRGIGMVKNVLKVFILLGVLTAMWRASGTIPYIIYEGAKFIEPSLFIVLTFLLCAGLSFLIGSAFGTVATMGVICIALARTMNINELYVGGAILSGIFFGDRCSPMSSTAILMSEISNTNNLDNIKLLLRTSLVPIILTSIIYYIMGMNISNQEVDFTIINNFSGSFEFNIILILPALIIIVFSLFKIEVKKAMLASIVSSFLIAFFYQGESILKLIRYSVIGYSSNNIEINQFFNGGGISSMLSVSIIIFISSLYSGLFSGTRILDNFKKYVKEFSEKTNVFLGIWLSGIFINMITCNQTLAAILSFDFFENMENNQKLVIDILNSSVLMSALIPWSIGLAVPTQAIEVSPICAVFACYIYIVPIYNLLINIIGIDNTRRSLLLSQNG